MPEVAHLRPNRPAKIEPIDNTELVSQFHDCGGKLLHIRPADGKRGMTFAYRVKGSRIELATAVQHRNDDFTKKMGTKTAIEHFVAGKTVFFPFDKNYRATDMLIATATYLG
jgi:hypothetical protein